MIEINQVAEMNYENYLIGYCKEGEQINTINFDELLSKDVDHF